MANLEYVNNSIVVYDATTGTQHPGVGLVLDGLNQKAAVPQTVISTPSVSGIYLITLYVRAATPSTGVGATSTIGPCTVFFSVCGLQRSREFDDRFTSARWNLCTYEQ